MNHRQRLAAVLLTLLAVVVSATGSSGLALGQQQHRSTADTSPFRPLNLRPANAVRGASGRPGPAYWQQRVDYRIAATLDVEHNTLRGEETIHYVNNSPDRLEVLWLHLEQNMCAAGSVSELLDQPPLRFLDAVFDFSCKGFAGGITLHTVASQGSELEHTVYGTTMRIDLPKPLEPGADMQLQIDWSFPIPEYGSGRMGRDGEMHAMAQWYPRLAVYDDVHGWNQEPYIGAGEFYLEYGAFDVELTVPSTYIVAATGELQNPEEVLTAAERERLGRALLSDVAVAIITEQEATQPELTRPTTDGELTWHFSADKVRDFAFAASPGLRWDASGWNGIRIETLYRPAASSWQEANRIARDSIRHFSERWYPYPYSHATTVEGPIEGMEYPMITFTPDSDVREDLHWVIAHEFGHEWFPMIVGSNERLYPWMDEGFNTFIDLEAAAKYFAGDSYSETIESNPLSLYAGHATAQEQPLIARPVEVQDLFWTAYQKPALMLSLLRDEVVGREAFERGLQAYIRAWAYKHPTPADFFRTMREVTGTDLDWFWRGWVYSAARLDQAVDAVLENDDGGTSVVLANRGGMVMPVEIEVGYGDRTSERVRLPVQMWNLGNRFTFRVPAGKRVVSVVVDPRRALPDVDRSNNSWLQ